MDMSDNNFPEKIQEVVSDVVEAVSDIADKVEDKVDELADKGQDLADKSLAELSDLFVKLKDSADSMTRSKEADAIKSAFYKLLSRLKGENGDSSSEGEGDSRNNPFEAVEQNFKAVYADYKKERAEYNKQQDEQREENLVKKQAVIDELKALIEGQDDVSSQFPAFRELQNRWRDAGPVPVRSFREINDTYQYYVERFYDMVKINRDLRDLDFKKNLEAKEAFCAAAEKLSENENVVEAFHELQKLHEQWKELGPVAKEKRDEIWERFKAATSVINKKYHAYFEGMKGQQEENLAKKTELCEQLEALVAKEVTSSSEWNTRSKEISDLQAQWRKIGFATKKENQKIYDRFRAACDDFFTRKREYFTAIKGNMNENYDKKVALVEQAEELKNSTDWKKTTDKYISLQKQWKEIGSVPRKKSEQLWKKFRAACDEFFANRDANVEPENDFYGNLKAKKKIISEVLAYEPVEDETANAEMMRNFSERWQQIGHVPFKDKDSILDEFREAMQQKFPLFSVKKNLGASGRGGSSSSSQRSAKDSLVAKYRALQQDITTYENNIGFFAASKNSEPLIRRMQEKIDSAKAELKELEAKILKAGEEEN